MAVRWLKQSIGKQGPGCNIAVSECTGSHGGEIVDAIGMRSVGEQQHSVLVEVKMSLADFRADARKPHRNGSVLGMGSFRYYLAPEGTIPHDEVPLGWGLIEVNGRGKLIVRRGHVLEKMDKALGYRRDWSAWLHPKDDTRETALLIRLLERVGDVDELHRRLKKANRDLAYSIKAAEAAEQQRRAIDAAYWALKAQMETAQGRDPSIAIPRIGRSVPGNLAAK